MLACGTYHARELSNSIETAIISFPFDISLKSYNIDVPQCCLLKDVLK